jgi:hypothetical protein
MSLSVYCDTDDWSTTVNQITNEYPEFKNMDMHIDLNCISNNRKKINCLILQESPAILELRNILQFVKTEECSLKYNKVYTCIKELLHLPYVEYIHPSNITWIKNKSFLPKKTKMISMISSNNSAVAGHRLRLSVLETVKNFVDVYGRGFNQIENKEQGLVDYYYSISIENDNTDNYFSEKLLDCFLTCTIPIYWGSTFPYTIFNPDGIINLCTVEKPNDLKLLDKHFYNKKIDAIVDNFFIAEKENRYLSNTLKQILLKFYNEHNK